MSDRRSWPWKPHRKGWATFRPSGRRRARSAMPRGTRGPAGARFSAGGGTIRARKETRWAGAPRLASGTFEVPESPPAPTAIPAARAATAATPSATSLPRLPNRRTPRKLSFDAMSQAAETVVMKFGGTSVADAERVKAAAHRIVQRKEAGNRVVAVLSARGKTTDELVAMAHEVSPRPHPREMDMLLSTGERISCALAAMVINDLGHEAISLTGSQAGIVTDTSHTRAKIVEVRADRIRRGLDEGKIVLVAGFQGVSTSADVTTLGRGGSDTTAVALAAALGADVCEIFTDVAGVFSADPRIVPDARKLVQVSFEEMLEMAAS